MALTEKLVSIADAIRTQSGKTEKLTLARMPMEILDLQSLNFEVVGGTAAPADPGENTIWVDTDTPVTGWHFGAAEPEAPRGGMVWIATGTASAAAFNALKKNGITACPLRTAQYVDGAFVSRAAKIYQGGSWKSIPPTVYLFKSGEGKKVNFTTKLSGSVSGYECSITTGNITASSYVSNSEAGYVSFYTTGKVNLTGFHTLYFDVKVTKAWEGDEPTFGVASAVIPASESGINKFAAKTSLGVSSRKTVSIDISNVDSGYVGAWACGNFVVYNIWYE